MVYREIKDRVREIMDVTRPDDVIGRIFEGVIISLILIGVILVILESVDEFSLALLSFVFGFEVICIAIFSVEYLLRLWCCTSNPEYAHPVYGRLRYMVSPMAVVDLLAILPFYIPFIIPVDLRFLRIIRLARIFRLLKIARYSDAFHLLGRVVKREKAVLGIIFFVIAILIVISSILMYDVEHAVQPENFANIPSAMWWAAVTLTTVGYGDIYPITPVGKFLGAVIAFLGIGLFALPAGVLAAGFVAEIKGGKGEDSTESAGSPGKRIELLERLARLRQDGHIDDAEYAAEKDRILSETWK